jgi:1,2-phenylacetyl-CoA epoxidase PaaB subunit
MASYLVFARTEYAEPLEHKGNLEAADDGQASKVAIERFGEQWLEMVLVPEKEVHWVQRDEAGMEAQA